MTTLTPFDIISGLHEVIPASDAARRRPVEDDYTGYTKTMIETPDFKYEMKEYMPVVFADIRARNGIDTETFLTSFSLPEEDRNVVTQSTGRSGSFFYSTPDRMFFYKTLLYPEVETMKSLLPEYWRHLRKYKKSFIMRMYGLYRCTADDSVWILVMGSVFPRGVHMDEIFDLKGRKPKPGKSVTDRGVMSDKILKDNEICRKLEFEHIEDKFFFNNQLQRDVELLCKYQIMDYSLLVGVHHITEEEWENYLLIDEIRHEDDRLKHTRNSLIIKPNQLPSMTESEDSDDDERTKKKKEIKTLMGRGEIRSIYDLNAVSGIHPESGFREVFFFGIIDCLTGYLFGKKVANFFKTFLWDKETLSTVKAEFYAERFLTFMQNELVYDESIHTDMNLAEPEISDSTDYDDTSGSHKPGNRTSITITRTHEKKPKKRKSSRRRTMNTTQSKMTGEKPLKTAR